MQRPTISYNSCSWLLPIIMPIANKSKCDSPHLHMAIMFAFARVYRFIQSRPKDSFTPDTVRRGESVTVRGVCRCKTVQKCMAKYQCIRWKAATRAPTYRAVTAVRRAAVPCSCRMVTQFPHVIRCERTLTHACRHLRAYWLPHYGKAIRHTMTRKASHRQYTLGILRSWILNKGPGVQMG